MLRHLLFQTIRRIVADPRVQQKAAATYDKEVKPRIQEAGKFAKDNIDFARGELKDIATEINPLDNPGGFLRKAQKRLFKGDEGRETDKTTD